MSRFGLTYKALTQFGNLAWDYNLEDPANVVQGLNGVSSVLDNSPYARNIVQTDLTYQTQYDQQIGGLNTLRAQARAGEFLEYTPSPDIILNKFTMFLLYQSNGSNSSYKSIMSTGAASSDDNTIQLDWSGSGGYARLKWDDVPTTDCELGPTTDPRVLALDWDGNTLRAYNNNVLVATTDDPGEYLRCTRLKMFVNRAGGSLWQGKVGRWCCFEDSIGISASRRLLQIFMEHWSL